MTWVSQTLNCIRRSYWRWSYNRVGFGDHMESVRHHVKVNSLAGRKPIISLVSSPGGHYPDYCPGTLLPWRSQYFFTSHNVGVCRSLNGAFVSKHTRDCYQLISRGQNGRHFADDIFRCIFVNEKFSTLIKISLKYVPKGPIDNIPALV